MAPSASPRTPSPLTFAGQVKDLEDTVRQLSGLYADLVAMQTAEAEAKAEAYLSMDRSISHGERQAVASHQCVHLTTDVARTRAEIQQLEAKRDLLQFLIDRVEYP